jgi:hypothetical protein
VGPAHLIATTNNGVTIYDTSGKFISFTFLGAFLSDQPDSIFDPHVIFDQADGRFMVIASVRRSDIQQGHVDFAVSATSDPTGSWTKYQLSDNDHTWPDFPSIGLSSTSVYITSDQVPFGSGTAQERLMIIGLQSVLAGAPTLSVTEIQNVNQGFPFGGAMIPAMIFGPSDFEYFLTMGADNAHVRLFSVPVNGPPSVSETDIQVPAHSQATQAVQPGGQTITSGGMDIMSEVWRDGSLWATQTVAGSNGQPVVRWYRIDTSAKTLIDSGAVSGAGNAYFGAIMPLADGSAVMVYSTSSATQPISGGYSARQATDPPGTMPISGIYLQGSGHSDPGRWGDFSTLSPDPDGLGAWGMVEDMTSSIGTTAIVHLATPGNAGVTVSISPAVATIAPGATQQFTATVQNTSSTTVTWSVDGIVSGNSTAGTISDAGLYTAPANAGGHQVVATSTVDTTKSASAAVTVTSVTPQGNPDFAISISPSSLSLHAGASGTTTANITPSNGFSAQVTLTCSGLPTGASCSASPVAGTANQTLKITTTGTTGALREPDDGASGFAGLALFSPLGILIVCGPRRRKFLRDHGARLCCLMLTAVLIAIAGCGGSVGTSPVNTPTPQPPVGATPLGTYNITVTATSGSLQHSATLTLVIQ